MKHLVAALTALLYHLASQVGVWASPEATLPPGFELVTAAAPPMVRHPIMGCVAPDGSLYVGDAAGLNLNKAELEAQLPNRVLKLVDDNGDGAYDRATIFADRMTFPQGACWVEGSLYVASPPGIWKLTDTNHDGVADERRMIVGGFDYTGNAADVHGPFLHPNGRLYWCHGRKGHRVVQEPERRVVHEGLASGIWSCLPDGREVRWHALGCADNPTEIDFTPEGDLIGTCNLYYSQPRGDTLMHWQEGGVYERGDMMKAIAGLPRTLERMPVVHNFGHVAVSGCTFARTEALFPADPGRLQLLVTHFNTQRVVRMELIRSGSTYRATEHEFLKIHDPDVHVTDVIEDRDGSLLVLDTGGWFRIGCPSSLMAKPDVRGGVYRVRRKGMPAAAQPLAWRSERLETVAGLGSADPHLQRRACEKLLHQPVDEASAQALVEMLRQPLDPALEHAAVLAAVQMGLGTNTPSTQAARDDRLLSRLVRADSVRLMQKGDAEKMTEHRAAMVALAAQEGTGPLTREAALFVLVQTPGAGEVLAAHFESWLAGDALSPLQALVLERVLTSGVPGPQTVALVAGMLEARSGAVQRLGLQIAARLPSLPAEDRVRIAVQKRMASVVARKDPASPGELSTLLTVAQRVRHPGLDGLLEQLASREELPVTQRLRAMAAQSESVRGLSAERFAFLLKLTEESANVAARLEALRMLTTARLTPEQLQAALDTVPQWGPLELGEWIQGLRKYQKPGEARLIAAALARSPVLGSVEESTFRTLASAWPPEAFALLSPAVGAAHAAVEAKKRQLETLARRVQETGRPAEGRKLFTQGRGTCLACHQVGEVGRALGPDLTTIGAIRKERDLLESILFPSATLARDYETHAIETRDGQSHLGLIRSHTAEGLLLVDLAGQEKNLRHDEITAQTTLTTSLMPMGLDLTLSEQELCDLVAWLLTCRERPAAGQATSQSSAKGS